jgi:hypothetical protein
LSQQLDALGLVPVIRVGASQIFALGFPYPAIPSLVEGFSVFCPQVLDSIMFFLEFPNDSAFVFFGTTVDDNDFHHSFPVDALGNQTIYTSSNKLRRIIGRN